MKRWLIRSMVLWAISGPLFYAFGFPALLDYTSKKIRRDNYAQCIAQLTGDGTIGKPDSPITQAQGDVYCHCGSDSLTFSKDDLWDAMRKKPPAALTATAQALADKCGEQLRAEQEKTLEPATSAPAPAPQEDVIYIN